MSRKTTLDPTSATAPASRIGVVPTLVASAPARGPTVAVTRLELMKTRPVFSGPQPSTSWR